MYAGFFVARNDYRKQMHRGSGINGCDPDSASKPFGMMHDMTQPTGSRHSESDVGRFKRKPMQQSPASLDDASRNDL